MIEALQIANNVFKAGQFTPAGLFADVLLITSGYDDVEINCTRVSISRGVDNSYTVINFIADEADFEELLARIPLSTLGVKFYAVTPSGDRVISHNFELAISEFRYDNSPNAYALSVVSRTVINIPKSADIDIAPLMSFKRYDNPLRYVFGLNPEQYALYSINTLVTYYANSGPITGPITSFRLHFNANQAHQLEVEVTPA